VNALELQAVTKVHPGAPSVVALRDVSLVVAAGEFVAVMGPSGSGKSTLLAVAGTLERPTSGTVRVAGTAVEDLADADLSGIRSRGLGFVFQQFHLMPTRSVLHNVADGLLYRGLPAAERLERAAAAVDAVGMRHRADHRPGELSGGECQRAAIARAIVGDPALVLADADLDRAANGIAWGGLFNSGQVCISIERVYVEEPVYDEFLAKLVKNVRQLRQVLEHPPHVLMILRAEVVAAFHDQMPVLEDKVGLLLQRPLVLPSLSFLGFARSAPFASTTAVTTAA